VVSSLPLIQGPIPIVADVMRLRICFIPYRKRNLKWYREEDGHSWTVMPLCGVRVAGFDALW